MTVNETDDQLIERMRKMELEAGDIAMSHIARHNPFATLPETVKARLLEDFQRIGQARGISRSEMMGLLEQDIPHYLSRFRSTALNMMHIGSVRLAVLIHVAVAIGDEETLKVPGLWDALREKRYDDAADCLQMSRWPLTATKPEEQMRILAGPNDAAGHRAHVLDALMLTLTEAQADFISKLLGKLKEKSSVFSYLVGVLAVIGIKDPGVAEQIAGYIALIAALLLLVFNDKFIRSLIVRSCTCASRGHGT